MLGFVLVVLLQTMSGSPQVEAQGAEPAAATAPAVADQLNAPMTNQTPNAEEQVNVVAPPANEDRVVCRRTSSIGTRLGAQRCSTDRQERQIRAAQQEELRRSTQQNIGRDNQ